MISDSIDNGTPAPEAEQPRAKRRPAKKTKPAKKSGRTKKTAGKPKSDRANKKAEVWRACTLFMGPTKRSGPGWKLDRLTHLRTSDQFSRCG